MPYDSLTQNPGCLKEKGSEMNNDIVLEESWSIDVVNGACSKGTASIGTDDEDSLTGQVNGNESRKENVFRDEYDLGSGERDDYVQGSGKLVDLGNDDALGYSLRKNQLRVDSW